MPRGPLFIVGSPRSGTSALVRAALKAGYTGFHEGNFLSLLRTIERDVDRHFRIFGTTDARVLMSRIDATPLKDTLFATFRNIVDAQQSSPLWVDKTGNPDMIEAIPILRSLWPRSVFIFAKRRGIENVLSRMEKFPRHTFDFHCADWARNLTAWRVLREAHPDLPGIEIDQRDMIEQPATVARMIVNHLELSNSVTESIAWTVRKERPQETRSGSSERVVSITRTGWSEAQIQKFHELCGQEMTQYGYTTDESYRVERNAA